MLVYCEMSFYYGILSKTLSFVSLWNDIEAKRWEEYFSSLGPESLLKRNRHNAWNSRVDDSWLRPAGQRLLPRYTWLKDGQREKENSIPRIGTETARAATGESNVLREQVHKINTGLGENKFQVYLRLKALETHRQMWYILALWAL